MLKLLVQRFISSLTCHMYTLFRAVSMVFKTSRDRANTTAFSTAAPAFIIRARLNSLTFIMSPCKLIILLRNKILCVDLNFDS